MFSLLGYLTLSNPLIEEVSMTCIGGYNKGLPPPCIRTSPVKLKCAIIAKPVAA
ncbi:MAG: hypothetical protein JW999_09205 [Methanotrichaceae archaeon]|nr:hypothetical protein [Methanotrichaceae archaeon]